MKTFLILGAGTGGTMMANKLVKRLDPKEWKIILVDKDETHYYQPGFLFLPFEYYKPEEVYQPKRKFVPSGVEFILSDVELIEPEANKVTLAKEKKVIYYDQLLIATGTDIHPEEVDGMLDGWRQNIFDYFTFDGAMALRGFLKNFKGGRVVLNIKEMPIKCPVAPLEFVYLADYFFTQKGMRNKVDLIFTTPLSGPFTKPVSNKLLGDVMTKKGIHTEAEFDVMEVDAAKNIIRGYDGRELEYDLLVSIPTNMGSDVIKRSGMGDDLYFVPTNKDTLRSEKYENVWVIGEPRISRPQKQVQWYTTPPKPSLRIFSTRSKAGPSPISTTVTPPVISFLDSTRACSLILAMILNHSRACIPSLSLGLSPC